MNAIVIVGSVRQDYVIGVERAPKPGETALATSFSKQPGGMGANQAVAAALLGAEVALVACIGGDDDGSRVLLRLRSEGVRVGDIEMVSSLPTGLSIVGVEKGGDSSTTVVPGANAALTPQRVATVLTRLCATASAVLVQADISLDVVVKTLVTADAMGCRPILHLTPHCDVPPSALSLADPLVINESQASNLVGFEVTDQASGERAAADLLGRARSVVIMFGSLGAVWAEPTERGICGAIDSTSVEDTSWAGCAFVGAMASELGRGSTLASSVAVGVAAASYCVQEGGTPSSFPTALALQAFMGAGTQDGPHQANHS